MKTIFEDQMEFLKAGKVELGTEASRTLSQTLVVEEYKEFIEEIKVLNTVATTNPELTKQALGNAVKEAIDTIYVLAQWLNVVIGEDKAQEAWDKVHKNNMSKCINGVLVKREDGKVLKPESYKKLDPSALV